MTTKVKATAVTHDDMQTGVFMHEKGTREFIAAPSSCGCRSCIFRVENDTTTKQCPRTQAGILACMAYERRDKRDVVWHWKEGKT